MALFNLLKKPKQNNYGSKYQSKSWNEEIPRYDYDPDVYDQNYPRTYPMTSYATLEDGYLFTGDAKELLLRDLNKRIIFTDAPSPEGNRLVDVSDAQDRSILAWNQTIGGELCLVVSTCEKGKGIALNEVSNYAFSGFYGLESIEWNNVVSTKNVVTMRRMFEASKSLKSLDLSCFDVRNVKFLEGLLADCPRLTDIKWFPLDQTGKIENTDFMFSHCNDLRSVNLSGFNTSSLKSCRGMFNDSGIRAINLGDWYPTSPDKTLNVEKMFAVTGLLSVLTTRNPLVQKEYMNMDEATRYCQVKNDIPRRLVSPADWRVPVYAWDRPQGR